MAGYICISPRILNGCGIMGTHSSGKEGSMKKVLCGLEIANGWVFGLGRGMSTEANAQVVPPAVPAAPTTLDVVTLKNGSII